MKLVDSILAQQPQLQEIRRDLHAHPELRYEETRTSEVVARELAACGIEVHRGLGGTGVVGVLRAGSSPRLLGLRADMDALPIAEVNEFAHRSRHAGKMHACGHDGHTAMLLGAARHLAATRQFDGGVVFIFQPAEEGGAGAQKMIDDGLFERWPCAAVYAMHNWPGLKVGQFGFNPGPLMASGNLFEIRIKGKGAHAALPHLGVDPVMVAVQVAQGLQTIVTRAKKPIDAAVLSITVLRAGDTHNVVPDEALLGGTVRTFDERVTDLIESRMREVATLTAAAHGAQAEVSFNRYYPPTVNHPAETTFVADVAAAMVGEANVVRQHEPAMTAEDFSFMLKARPGSYFVIGNGDGAHREMGHGIGPCMLHNPSYDFNDDLLPVGASYWVQLAKRFLSEAPLR